MFVPTHLLEYKYLGISFSNNIYIVSDASLIRSPIRIKKA